ncbi:MAG: hypothetical protein VX498_13900 [Myxococcota bacterium]|nr:hypothetical protein [Myxococcota bacterium]
MKPSLLFLLCLSLVSGVLPPSSARAQEGGTCDSGEATAAFRRGFVDQKGSRSEEALRHYSECLEIEPGCLPCNYEIGWSYWVLERWPQTVRHWEFVAAVDADYETLPTYLPRAKARLPAGSTEPAVSTSAVQVLLAVCFGGIVTGAGSYVRALQTGPSSSPSRSQPPPPLPETPTSPAELCRRASVNMAASHGQPVSASDTEEFVAECTVEYGKDPEVRSVIDCMAEADQEAERAVCFDSPVAKRAKRTEAHTYVDGIRTAEKAYHHEWDSFTTAGWTPPRLYGKEQGRFEGGGYRAFLNLGWIPDGKVRCRYRTTAYNGASSAADDFVVEAECDIDGDGVKSMYRANRASKAALVTPEDVY